MQPPVPEPALSNTAPSEVSVRMYNVGFGDCFLVTFTYTQLQGRNERTMLVDFGTTQRNPTGPSIGDIATLIRDHTNGELDVVVATHRHKDHISGFGGAASDKVMTSLQPKMVIRPWTDNPLIAADAEAPSDLDPVSHDFVRLLAARDTWMRNLATIAVHASTGTRRNTADLAEDQLPNLQCIERLDRWASAANGCYVKAGDVLTPVELPGVTLQILGPPTLRQSPGLASETFTSKEFWAATTGPAVLAGRTATDADLVAALRALAPPDGYGEARWLLSRLSKNQVHQLFDVVRTFDDALNNTSIIMLITVGSRSMLFSGDAQIENWDHSLTAMSDGTAEGHALRSDLADIDLYKVGHHGSRNATPRSLFELWQPGNHRGTTRPPLVTMMSTLPGKHGKLPATAVPKQNLVEALERCTTLVRTDTLDADQPVAEVVAHATGPDGFSRS